MNRRTFTIAALACASLATLMLFGDDALARPGGGHSYSGGGYSGSSGGGSGGGDGGALVYLLMHLVFRYPAIGIPLVCVIIAYTVYSKRANNGLADWESGMSLEEAPPPTLAPIRAVDPDFSEVVFSDFAYALYARAYAAIGDQALEGALAPYLSEQAVEALSSRHDGPANVVIGNMRVVRVGVDNGQQSVTLRFESNVVDDNSRLYMEENWTLWRAATATSPSPQVAQNLGCPNCGGAYEYSPDNRCSYCDEIIHGGHFGWQVSSILTISIEERTTDLTGYAPERGTDLETVYHPEFHTELAALAAEDPGGSTEAMWERVQTIFAEVNRGWNADDLKTARPFVSDPMFGYLGYWLRAYSTQGLQNHNDEAEITNWDIAKVTRDHYYDAVTVRIWAKGLDYTVRKSDGDVVGGSKRRSREFSEYWTLIRGAAVRGKPKSNKHCPNCGAELQINQAGSCEFCQAHITSGEFDWVLSKIEQDDSYRG